MRGRILTTAFFAAGAIVSAPAHPEPLRAQTIPAPSEGHAFLLQADSDPEPEWAVQNTSTLIIAGFSDSGDTRKYTLPADVTLFDVRDTNGDGSPELAAVRGGALCYWSSLDDAATESPDHCVEEAELAPLAYGAPRPARLFVTVGPRIRLSAPGIDRKWDLTAQETSTTDTPSGVQNYRLAYFHVWRAASPYNQENFIDVFRFAQVYETVSDRSESLGNFITSAQGRQGGTRRARDAAHAGPAAWPWFPLTASPVPTRVLYALAPPDYRDTLIRFQRAGRTEPLTRPGPQRISPDRRYPGIIIAPAQTPPDFNGDGYADLLLWNTEPAGRSLGRLLRAAQSGTWSITLSVHLFDPRIQRYAARPDTAIQLQAPIDTVLAGGVNGPFKHLLTKDVNGDGRSDIVTSGVGDAFAVYTYDGGLPKSPAYETDFGESVQSILVDATSDAGEWYAVVRTASAFHGITLPDH